ncbi:MULTISPECIES: transcription termination factor Rho [unclassified Fibrobacter]|uniref:transcription termination factor Rho n=1 Tax=unclassified Fibrobacter TaxID=2634177 RepID=UPI0032E4EF89
MPRQKKVQDEPQLLSDTIDLNSPIDYEKLGDLAQPIPSAEGAEPQPKRRGRPSKKTAEAPEPKESSKTKQPASEQAPEPAPAAVESAPSEPKAEKAEAPADTTKPEADPNKGAQANGQNNPQNNGQNGGKFNNSNNNGKFNNNNGNNGKFNKFNKFKNRHNRNLPQDDFIDESIQLPPPPPEVVAAAKAKWRELRGLPMFELQQRAEELGIEDYKRMRKQALVYSILSSTGGEETPIYTEGVLEIIPEGGHGFLRNPDHNYLAGPDDIYISRNIIRRYDLKMGDTITGQVRQPREGEKYFALMRIDTVNFEAPEKTKRRVAFEYLTPIHPIEKLNLEWKKDEYSTRIMNLFTPIGKGQRSIILAPPRTGKTVLLQNVTQALTVNHPEVKLMVLLIDERPEEVTEMRKLIDRLKDDATRAGKNIQAEVLASTFDEPPERHIKVADMVLEKAKRLVEHGNDVVILLDSITRFARANNVVIPHSGKILSGGVDANAMQRPKRFFGAARKIENGGSLTIIGTALIETGSRMDEVIFEEFKGTGNMELVLDRRIAEKRIWPAIDIFKSGTRKEELLLSDEELRRVWVLRRYLQDMTTVEIMEFMRDKLKLFETNRDFLTSMNG